MTFHRTTGMLFALALALSPGAGITAREQQSGPYLVVFKSGALPDDAAARVANAGGQLYRELPEIGALSVSGDDSVIAALSGDADVLAVEPERFHGLPGIQVDEWVEPAVSGVDGVPVPGVDIGYGFQWNLRRIGAPAVWARLPLAGPRAIVAVIDSGVMHTHPDLAGQILVSKATSYCNTPGPGGMAGYPRYATLIDFVAHPNWTPADGCAPLGVTTHEGHGTHVAGTIAAKFGGVRVVGVAPDAAIAAYKVFDLFRLKDADAKVVVGFGAFDGPIFAAIIDAVNSGYPVINLSLGGLIRRSIPSHNAEWHAWDRVVKFASQRGTVIVAAAGNEDFNLNGPVASIPADLSSVISVSATGISALVSSGGPFVPTFVPGPGAQDVLAFYSNYGSPVDVSAPGGDCGPALPPCVTKREHWIYSTYITPIGGVTYAFAYGTSMAAPHVAAVAAMVRQLHPDWTPGHVRAHLKATADDIGSRQLFGGGLINASLAVQ